jgi:predicted GNAT family acetyltransferase
MTRQSSAEPNPVGVTMQHTELSDAATVPSLPESLLIRRAEVSEAADLAELLGGVYLEETWEPEGTELELFRDSTVKTTLIVESQDQLVATASLQIHPDTPETGWVRWVGTQASWRRQGLARAVVLGVLIYAKNAGCRQACLRTETDRSAAISLYLQLGFKPKMQDDTERQVWKRLMENLFRAD